MCMKSSIWGIKIEDGVDDSTNVFEFERKLDIDSDGPSSPAGRQFRGKLKYREPIMKLLFGLMMEVIFHIFMLSTQIRAGNSFQHVFKSKERNISGMAYTKALSTQVNERRWMHSCGRRRVTIEGLIGVVSLTNGIETTQKERLMIL